MTSMRREAGLRISTFSKQHPQLKWDAVQSSEGDFSSESGAQALAVVVQCQWGLSNVGLPGRRVQDTIP